LVPSAFLAGRLCALPADEAFIDSTHLHFSGLVDAASGAWSCELADEIGIELARMPRIVAPNERVGGLSATAARDCGLLTGTPVFNNPEGFENGLGDWYAESGVWQVGVPTSGPGAAHTGTNCAATVLSGKSDSGVKLVWAQSAPALSAEDGALQKALAERGLDMQIMTPEEAEARWPGR